MKDKIIIQIINKSTNELPKYETIGSAGMDVRAELNKLNSNMPNQLDYMLYSNTTALIPTGLYVAIPVGYEIQVRPRSGLAAKFNISVLNSVGTIDSDYRGEIKIILHNNYSEPFLIKSGDRIAQLVLKKSPQLEWKEVQILPTSDRGEGGFGSTGNK